MDSDTKEKITSLRGKGNTHFKAAELLEALQVYSEAVEIVKGSLSPALSKEDKDFCNDQAVKLLSNRAAVYLKLGKYKEVVDDCGYVLVIDAMHVKALYRRSQALEELGEFKPACEDLGRIIQVNKFFTECIHHP